MKSSRASSIHLQNIYRFSRVLLWSRLGAREFDRPKPVDEGISIAGFYARYDGRWVGFFRGTAGGPLYFDGPRVIHLTPDHGAIVTRLKAVVRFTLMEGTQVVDQVSYVPDPVTEFDMYEGRPYGLFDQLEQNLGQPSFFKPLPLTPK